MAGALCSCESVRTVYDEFGNEVKESDSGGGEKDLATHMEEKFNASFSEKKNAQGVPQTVSNRVSSFQKELDASARVDKEYLTKGFDTSTNDVYSMRFSGADKQFSGAGSAYSGGMGNRIEKELHPAFASQGKGIYADSFAGASSRYGREGERSSANGSPFDTNESYYSREMESGYIESRRENTPPPRVMSRDEYYRKSIEETRTMLGRDD